MSLQVSLSPANYETWLKDTQLLSTSTATASASRHPTAFAKDWLENRYRSLIAQTLARVVGYSVNVEFEVRELGPDAPGRGGAAGGGGSTGQAPGSASSRVASAPPEGGERQPQLPLHLPHLHRGVRANRLAHAASLSVAERPGRGLQPTCSSTAAWAWARPT